MELQTSYRVDRMLRHNINCRAPAGNYFKLIHYSWLRADSIRILETLLVVTLSCETRAAFHLHLMQKFDINVQ